MPPRRSMSVLAPSKCGLQSNVRACCTYKILSKISQKFKVQTHICKKQQQHRPQRIIILRQLPSTDLPTDSSNRITPTPTQPIRKLHPIRIILTLQYPMPQHNASQTTKRRFRYIPRKLQRDIMLVLWPPGVSSANSIRRNTRIIYMPKWSAPHPMLVTQTGKSLTVSNHLKRSARVYPSSAQQPRHTTWNKLLLTVASPTALNLPVWNPNQRLLIVPGAFYSP